VLRHPAAVDAAARFGASAVSAVVRERLDALRVQVGLSSEARIEAIATMAAAEAERRFAVSPGPVINATGTMVHANLGRVPLSDAALEAILRVALGYSALDYDLEQGTRGARTALLAPVLGVLTGADDGIVLNNHAGGVHLALTALARGREVVFPRAHTVEFGSGYGAPPILAESGVEIVEVGSSSRTRLSDYEEVINPRTAVLVHSHPHHIRAPALGEQVTLSDLVALGKRHGIPVVDELGGGCLLDSAPYGLAAEPLVQDSVAAGADLVCFPGDRLLGGPQSGIVVGGMDFVARLKRHPLLRLLRVDKVTMAALHATLLQYIRGEAATHIPIWQMIGADAETLRRRAMAWREQVGTIPKVRIETANGRSSLQGGSVSGETLPTTVLTLRSVNTSRGWAAHIGGLLRRRQLPVLARIEPQVVVLDPRTVLERQDADVVAAVAEVLQEP
jgi:L-seryl-tRNA(Ser) seleniumtransferase